MVSFNRVILGGNLTRDPELKITQGGIPVCNFGIAVNRVRSKNEEVDFFDIAAWRELGEAVANHKKKGDPVLVEGRLQYRTYEAQDGSKRTKVDIQADNIQFLGRAGNGEGGGQQSPAPQQSSATQRAQPKPETKAERLKRELAEAEAEEQREAEDPDGDFEDIPF